MKNFSKAAKNLIGQPMFGLLAKARQMEKTGRRIFHFEIGDPNFNSPTIAKEAAKKALDNNITHYANSMGMIEFRSAVAEYTKRTLGFKPNLEQIVSCPANAIIDFVSRCVVNPGEEIIYPDPGFPTYYSVINYNGFIPVGIKLKEENSFQMSPDDVARSITNKTRLIIINTPQNPTGSVMTEDEVLAIYKIAKKRDIYLLSDEVYSNITYGKPFFSPSVKDLCKTRTIILNSLSKVYSMSGWRLGYAIGPESLIKKVGLLIETIISCLPPFIQLGGRAVLLGDHEFLKKRNAFLKERRDTLIKGLNGIPGLTCVVPDGAFYAFANIKGTGLSSDTYSERLLQESGVCVLPGKCFGKFGEGYVRFCYASISKEEIESALDKIKDFHLKQNKLS